VKVWVARQRQIPGLFARNDLRRFSGGRCFGDGKKISDARHPAVIHPQPLSSRLLQKTGVNNPTSQKRPRIRKAPKLYVTLRREILERDGWRCQKCGCSKNLDVHHLRRRSSLGDDAETNLITLCRECHQSSHGFAFSRVRRRIGGRAVPRATSCAIDAEWARAANAVAAGIQW
jgi:hypothetical protein